MEKSDKAIELFLGRYEDKCGPEPPCGPNTPCSCRDWAVIRVEDEDQDLHGEL